MLLLCLAPSVPLCLCVKKIFQLKNGSYTLYLRSLFVKKIFSHRGTEAQRERGIAGNECGFEGFKGMERGFSRIWRIFADFFLRLFKTNDMRIT